MHRWQEYYNTVGNRPNSIVTGVLGEYDIGRGAALDLGSGNFRDSALLLQVGFQRVVAIDSADMTLSVPAGIEFHRMSVEQYAPEKGAFDLIISCNTLFFISKKDVLKIFENGHLGLRNGGVFACNVLGERDGWATDGRDVSYFTDEEIRALDRRFNVTAVGDTERNGTVASGKPKHWHTWTIVFQKT